MTSETINTAVKASSKGALLLRSRLSEVFWLRRPVAYPCFSLCWLPERLGPLLSCLLSSVLFGPTSSDFPLSSSLWGFIKAGALVNATGTRAFQARSFYGCPH